MTSLAPLFLLAACSSGVVLPGPSPVEGTSSTQDTPEDTAGTADTDTTEDTDTVEEVGGTDTGEGETTPVEDGWPKACADLYDQDILPTFELEFDPDVWAAVKSDCSKGSQTYRPVQFTYDGETVSAMARLKGNWSWSCEKLQFVISFNEEDPTARFHGLRKVMLDAPWYDHSLLHERLAFPLFEARGIPYSCANNARLEVNGEYYGLYANLERIDHEYLERHFEDPGGNLYQGGSELKTNEDVNDTSDLTALNAAHTVEQIAELVDLDAAVAEWSMEAMIPAMDNYWAGVEINYYLYDHPTQGFLYVPYDLDISFGDSAYSDGSLIWPNTVNVDPITYEHYGWLKEQLVKTVLADPAWCERFVEELELSRAAYSPTELAAQLAEWDAQIGPSLEEDPHKTFTNARHAAAVSQLEAFFQARADVVDAWLAEGSHCPAHW